MTHIYFGQIKQSLYAKKQTKKWKKSHTSRKIETLEIQTQEQLF